jgi:two-component system, OmpR family, phosphate regulon sensor histidine kinase PhoR
MRRHLFYRIFAGFVIVSLLAVLISSLYTLRALRASSLDAVRLRLTELARAAKVAAAPIWATGRSAALDGLMREMGRETGTRFTVIDAGGLVLADSEQDPAVMENHAHRPEVAAAIERKVGIATRYSSTLDRWMVYVAVPFASTGAAHGVVRASAPRAELDAAILREGGELALFAAILFGACLLAALAISRTIASPLRDLAGVVGRFAAGDFGARLHLRRRDEVRQLAESFNAMGQRIQELFRENSERTRELDGIFSSVQQGIVLLDGEGRIVRSNRGFDDLAGRGTTSSGRALLEALPVPRVFDLVQKARSSGQRQTEELAIGERIILCSIERMAGSEQLIVLLHDTSEIHRVEELKRDFVANASHELRTPLTTIAGSLEMLGEASCGPEAERWIEAIRRNALRMTAIVQDLLLLSRLEAKEAGVEPQAVDLADIARETAVLFAHRAQTKGIRLTLDLPAALPPVAADPFLMEQMLVNLLDNGLKYTEAGEVRLSCSAEGDGRVRIEVSDTGIGIPPEHLPRIFERFYVVDKSRSRRLGGTGLGLAIVKHIVQRHAGTIETASAPGQGTRFTIRLPTATPGPNSQKNHTTFTQT